MRERVRALSEAPTSERWEDVLLNDKATSIIGALEELGLIKTKKVGEGRQIRTTSKWDKQRQLRPDTLPFPLNQQGHLSSWTGFGDFDGVAIGWQTSLVDYNEILIVNATSLNGPVYIHEVLTGGSSKSLKQSVFYKDGWIESDRGGVHSRLPLRSGNWDWWKEMDLLTIVADSLKATVKEAQRKRPLWSKVIRKLTGR